MTKTISALEWGKGRRKRVNVFLDDEYAFSLEAMTAARLYPGQELSQTEIDELRREDAVNLAQERALRLLEHRPRSRAELERRLRQAKLAPEAIEEALVRLERVELVDDTGFARYWVEQRLTHRPRSRMALQYELRRHGVSREAIDRALRDVVDLEVATALAESHLRERRRPPRLDAVATDTPGEGESSAWEAVRAEIAKLLQSRGFGYRTIEDTLAGLEEREAESGEPDNRD